MLVSASMASARFARNRKGSVALPFGVALTMLMACVGGAVDFSRWQSARRTTTDALDAAVLAGARALQTTSGNYTLALAEATSYFQTNISGRVDLSVNTVSFAMVDNNTAISATGVAKINSSFLGLIGINEMTVASETGSGFPKASFSIGGQGGSNLEISLMLDVTGSMCDSGASPCTASTKLTGLKDAAKRLVDLAIPANQTDYYAKMAVVPFAQRVRVAPNGSGGGLMTALTGLPAVKTFYEKECTGWTFASAGGSGSGEYGGGDVWTCDGWTTVQRMGWRLGPCVADRYYNATDDFDYTDDVPGSGRWLIAQDGSRRLVADDSSGTPLATGTGTSSDPAEQWNYTQSGTCWDEDNANEIMPLSTDAAALKARIDGLVAHGPTGGVLGTAWSWYTLSPNWSSIWTGTTRPGNYSDLTNLQSNGRPVLRKVAILMTDGVYNTARSWSGWDQTKLALAAKQMCANMKATGIEIFTVGLGLNELSTSARTRAEDILQTCGTDVSHFYSTLTPQDLQTAFQDIAYQLGGITLKR